MSRNIPSSYFPVPPVQYDQRYFSELTRAFSVFVDQQRNPGEGRNTKLVLTQLPTSDFGLESGTLFQQDGFVKITLINTPHAIGSVGTGAVGTVTVTTS